MRTTCMAWYIHQHEYSNPPACRWTSHGSTGKLSCSGPQDDDVFQEFPKSWGVLSGTPTGDLICYQKLK